MRVYNPTSDRILKPQVLQLLMEYRKVKHFDALSYVQAKSFLLNEYMKQCGLKSCVVAVSGGIDSAAVLAVVKYASKQNNSPIARIVPLLLPAFDNVGATGQREATNRGQEVCASQGLEAFIMPLNLAYGELKSNVENNLNIKGQEWAQGQLVAHTRTPTLYYTATLLAQENLPAIICGTTNRDEGLYLGYFGKASDGLVDTQIISDLHKSEVYKVAQLLGVPDSLIQVTPTGDMYDGRTDEEVFGAPYDFVEYYMYYLSLTQNEQQLIQSSLDSENLEQFLFFQSNLENMHRYNRHKYFGASPAVHFDLDFLDVPEGWKTNISINRPLEKETKEENFVNIYKHKSLPDFFYQPINTELVTHTVGKNTVWEINNLLSIEECDWILTELEQSAWKTVGIDGRQQNFDENQDIHGSLRQSWFSTSIAAVLYQRLSILVPKIEQYTQSNDIIGEKFIWSFTDINPLLRFIRYVKEHMLVAHYDDTYAYHDFKKTLKSLIIYLESVGETRFIEDNGATDYSDWTSLAPTELILKTFKAKKGSALIFDHRVLHDAPSVSAQKTIIRTDLTYEAPFLEF